MLNGTFLLLVTEKMPVMEWGGTTKREVSKASLQRTISNQILNVDQMFAFCSENIKGITYFLVKKEEIVKHIIESLEHRFETCVPIKGTRNFHKFHAAEENVIRCYRTSKSDSYEDHCTTKMVPLSLEVNNTVACVYDGQWWLAQIEQISTDNNDVYVHFYHPAGPRTSFKKSTSDRVWTPTTNILRKISVVELTTATGRSYSISQKLSEEISRLLISHLGLKN